MVGPQDNNQERDIRDSNFVFFGGSTGIGSAAAAALAQRGASILLVGRNREAGQAAAAELRDRGATIADFLQADLATVAGVAAAAEGVKAWRPALHGVVHTAMAAFSGKQITADGFEFPFALQYFARAALNRLLCAQLAASGDGRIVQIAGNVPNSFKPDLDDLQFERRKWSFFKSVLGTHVLGFMHIQEAAARWQGLPVTIAAACVGSTKTKAMLDPQMPLIMRLMGRFGTTPEKSATNAVRLLTQRSAADANGAVLRNPKQYHPEPVAMDRAETARLWDITTELAAQHGLQLP